MKFAFNQEQNMIREAVGALMGGHPAASQAEAGADGGYSPALWAALVNAGLPGTLVAPELQGSGLGLVEAGCVLECLGAELGSSPYLLSSVVASRLLSTMPPETDRDALLARMATGSLVACPLISCEHGGASIDGAGRQERLSGLFFPVLFGMHADVFLVVARHRETDTWKLAVISTRIPAMTSARIETADRSRGLVSIELDSVKLDTSQKIWDISAAIVRDAQLVGAAAQAAEMLGGASRVLTIACDYARERQQFGQPIGRFQSIKHMLADNRVLLDGLHSLVYAALWHLNQRTDEGAALASAAKAWASDVYARVAADTVQVFGAMGIAAESLPHLYLKRAHVDRILFGNASTHLELLWNESDRKNRAILPM